ncbi:MULTISPECIES: hypothetical protein [Herbaspirillum]|uniref:Uncharacterized protein n=2 Tax=Herbaspirillum huttiense TaxID=863372 RepID=A0AAJ2HB37_9BURK|nr:MULTISPECIES: hypothetical protein [Herbaspirillum]MDR9836845.1 hypothetical protein [Herbaspirillum huttiense]
MQKIRTMLIPHRDGQRLVVIDVPQTAAEAGDITEVLHVLEQLTATAESTEKFQGCVVLGYGYDEDPREISAIPAARTFTQQLHRHQPALLFMLHPYTLAGLIGCFEESPESVFIDGKFAGTKLDLRVVSRVFNEAIAAATSLMESKGVGEQSKKTALLRLQTVRNDMLTGINVAKKYAII